MVRELWVRQPDGSWGARGRLAGGPQPPFILGETKPNASNTGVDPSVTLTPIYGDVVISPSAVTFNGVSQGVAGNGYTLADKDVFGFVRVIGDASNVTIYNCRVRGRLTGYYCWANQPGCSPAGTNDGSGSAGYSSHYSLSWPGWYGLIDAARGSGGSGGSVTATGDRMTGGTALKIIRCTIAPDYPSWWITAIECSSSGMHVERCDISGGSSDQIRSQGNANAFGNYIHDQLFCDNDLDQQNWTPPPPAWHSHTDGFISTQTGNDWVIGNNFDMQPGNYVESGGAWVAGGRAGDAALLATYGRNAYRLLGGVGRPGGAGSSVTLANNNAAINNMKITKNWMSGGEVMFQCGSLNSTKYAGSSNNFGELSYNRVSQDNRFTFQLRWKSGAVLTGIDTNVWDAACPWDSVPANEKGVVLTTANGGIRLD